MLKEDVETAKAALKAWHNSQTAGDTESEATAMSTDSVSHSVKKLEKQQRRDRSRNSGSSVARTDPSTRRQLERTMQDSSVRRRFDKRASSLFAFFFLLSFF